MKQETESIPEKEKPVLPAPPSPEVTIDPVPREGVLQPAPIEPAGRYKVGEMFDQEVIVTRHSTFRILGNDVNQFAQYAIISRITIVKVNVDGSMSAEQSIQNARLIDASTEVKEDFKAAFEKVKGTKFELSVSPSGEVTAIKGITDPIHVKAGMDVVSQSLRLWSILDADAWKELAGLTFFQPDKPLKKGETWNKPATHDWGPLGRWNGKTKYFARGTGSGKPPADRIDYLHELHYSPQAGADRDLPIRIGKTEFQIVSAGGAILYDAATKRSRNAEESFRVRGRLVVSFAGTDATIDLEEQQNFKLTFTEPGQRKLVGQPFPQSP